MPGVRGQLPSSPSFFGTPLLLRPLLSGFFFPLTPPRCFWPTVPRPRPDLQPAPAPSAEPLRLPRKLTGSARLRSPPPPSAR